jgi:hypothetical protein
MKAIAPCGLFLLAAIACSNSFSQSRPARPQVPQDLQPPPSEKLVLQVHANGSQFYSCKPGPDQKYNWILKGPSADLYDPQNQTTIVGKHFEGPTWKHNDGSEVVGKLAASHDSPETSAIPWLLLTATNHTGDGVFSKVTYIQRVNTAGGKPLASLCDQSHANSEQKSPYSADYFFYAAQ